MLKSVDDKVKVLEDTKALRTLDKKTEEDWGPTENLKLCLSIYKHSVDWNRVSELMQQQFEATKRPQDFFSDRNCEAQFLKLKHRHKEDTKVNKQDQEPYHQTLSRVLAKELLNYKATEIQIASSRQDCKEIKTANLKPNGEPFPQIVNYSQPAFDPAIVIEDAVQFRSPQESIEMDDLPKVQLKGKINVANNSNKKCRNPPGRPKKKVPSEINKPNEKRHFNMANLQKESIPIPATSSSSLFTSENKKIESPISSTPNKTSDIHPKTKSCLQKTSTSVFATKSKPTKSPKLSFLETKSIITSKCSVKPLTETKPSSSATTSCPVIKSSPVKEKESLKECPVMKCSPVKNSNTIPTVPTTAATQEITDDIPYRTRRKNFLVEQVKVDEVHSSCSRLTRNQKGLLSKHKVIETNEPSVDDAPHGNIILENPVIVGQEPESSPEKVVRVEIPVEMTPIDLPVIDFQQPNNEIIQHFTTNGILFPEMITCSNLLNRNNSIQIQASNKMNGERRFRSLIYLDRNQNSGPSVPSTTSSEKPPQQDNNKTQSPVASKESLEFILGLVIAHTYAREFFTLSESEGSVRCKRPMDLVTIKDKLDNGAITSIAELERDLMLTFFNIIMTHREGHPIIKRALAMVKHVEFVLKDFRPISDAMKEKEDNKKSDSTEPDASSTSSHIIIKEKPVDNVGSTSSVILNHKCSSEIESSRSLKRSIREQSPDIASFKSFSKARKIVTMKKQIKSVKTNRFL